MQMDTEMKCPSCRQRVFVSEWIPGRVLADGTREPDYAGAIACDSGCESLPNWPEVSKVIEKAYSDRLTRG